VECTDSYNKVPLDKGSYKVVVVGVLACVDFSWHYDIPFHLPNRQEGTDQEKEDELVVFVDVDDEGVEDEGVEDVAEGVGEDVEVPREYFL